MQKQITDCIVRLMKSKNITQARLAVELNCTQTAVSNLLSGKSRLTINDIDLISKTLGINVSELIIEATNSNIKPINYPEAVEEVICKDKLTFYIVNKLKQPMSEEDLLISVTSKNLKQALTEKINELKKLKIINKSQDGILSVNVNKSDILHYRLTSEYSNRISEVYTALRPIVHSVTKNESLREQWKINNLDSFYLEYFSEDQIKQQNELLRQFLDLVKHHLRMNQNDNDSVKKELRVIFTCLAPYPTNEIMRTND